MFSRLACNTHEELYQVDDPATGLRGYIALHSTARGPAAGGLRMRVYPDDAAAIKDVLNLSRGMSYKNAAADLPLGGGKAVILGDPACDKTPGMLHAMGRAVESLNGRYWTAEDMGMSPDDMAEIARETRYVAGLDSGIHASGDPSPVTAQGVFNAMRIGARAALGRDELAGRRVAVQGLGHVGRHLCRLLHVAGARLVVADTDAARVATAVRECGAEPAEPDRIHAARVDVFAPCAIGGVLNADTIPEIDAALVCGAANNQLVDSTDADLLHNRGILYLPDYVANGGGIINVAAEILRISDRDAWVAEKLAALEATMRGILDRARADGQSPAHLADRMMGERLLKKAG